MTKYNRYGFSDLVVNKKIELQKYVEVKDLDGNIVDTVEIYFIEEEESND